MNLITRKIVPQEYPYLLQHISRLPPSMDIAGEMPSDDHKFLCVIGSRQYSSYGKNTCTRLISGLQGYPIVIVSGLAIGIDSMAHEAALAAGLKTIAFPGSGLSWNVLYPACERDLARRIVEGGGALLSPFKPHQKGDDWTFPTRNRLMAGVSHAVLIIEGRRGSGTLMTAKHAEDFNRDVMAVPGDISSDLSYGPHMLIRKGAACISSSEDILQEFGFIEKPSEQKQPALSIVPKKRKKQIDPDELDLSGEQKKFLRHVISEPLSATELIEKLSVSSSHFSLLASELEIRGLIREENGRYKVS